MPFCGNFPPQTSRLCGAKGTLELFLHRRCGLEADRLAGLDLHRLAVGKPDVVGRAEHQGICVSAGK